MGECSPVGEHRQVYAGVCLRMQASTDGGCDDRKMIVVDSGSSSSVNPSSTSYCFISGCKNLAVSPYVIYSKEKKIIYR